MPAAAVKIPASTFKDAVNGMTISQEARATLLARIPEDSSAVSVALAEEEKPLITAILNMKIARTTRTTLQQYVSPVAIPDLTGMSLEEFNSALATVPADFNEAMVICQGLKGRVFETKIMDRWYTFRMPEMQQFKHGKRILGFGWSITFQMVRTHFEVGKGVARENFKELYAGKSVLQILTSLDFRAASETDMDDADTNIALHVSRAITMAENYGIQVYSTGSVMENKVDRSDSYYGGDQSWYTFKYIFEREKGILEPELESPGYRRGNRWDTGTNQKDVDGVLPFVRVFSLRTRTYLFMDYHNVSLYVYRQDIMDRLVLEQEHLNVVNDIFNADENLIKDLIPGKTGGINVLASGPPGVGKTLTAEVFAEMKKRPLYSLSVSEIGTSPAQIETNLQRVFTRVERWKAVLLFDECDVFLSKRSDNLDQAAVCGMFLRLLDYYSGTMFLTTNRNVNIDDAVDSRIAFRIIYHALTPEDRMKVWVPLLQDAKIEMAPEVLQMLVDIPLDGRKIRNMTRAMQMRRFVNPTKEQINKLVPYIDPEYKPAFGRLT